MQFDTQHRREIDGLRSMAILPVLFYHAELAPFTGGYVGVDVFFVISGFLITSLIAKELTEARFSLLTFYERRARRILPALFFVMLVTLVIAFPWMLPNDLQDLFLSYLGVSTFSSNVLFWLQSGYFDAGVELKPMLHTWSLAVEEQFYVIFPLLMILCWKLGANWLMSLLLVLFCFSFALTMPVHQADAAANFYLLPTRAWELLLGSIASFIYVRLNIATTSSASFRMLGSALGMLGLLMILMACVLYDNQTPFPGPAALLPTVGTFFILLFATQHNAVGQLLSLSVLVGIGLVSYSAYLWHQPLLAMARLNDWTGAKLLFAIPLSLLLAYFSWRFIEKPFRNRAFLSRNTVLSVSALLSVAVAVAGFIGYKSDGYVARLNEQDQKIARFTQYPSEQLYRQDHCFLQPGNGYSVFADTCYEYDEEASKQLIWGDSHAAALSVGLIEQLGQVAQLTASACPPILHVQFDRQGNCEGINTHVLDFIISSKPELLWLHANWIDYSAQLSELENTIAQVKSISPETHIIIIGGVPQWNPSLPHQLLLSEQSLGTIELIETPLLAFLQPVDDRIMEITQKTDVVYYSLLDQLCKNNECKATARNIGELDSEGSVVEPMAWDAAHLTRAGSNYIASKLVQLMAIN